MGLFSKKDDGFFETDDCLIVIDTSQNGCEIYDNAIAEGDKVMSPGQISVPLADCNVFVGRAGRSYVVKVDDLRYVENAKRLAQLEQSTTLKQLVEFKPEKKANPNADMKFWAMFVACIIAIFL